MAAGSTAGLRSSRAFRTPAARWSGRTSASDPFTLPMGVRQASTTNTELTLTSWTSHGLRSHDTQAHSRGAGPLSCAARPRCLPCGSCVCCYMWKRLPGMKSRGFICRPVPVLAVGDAGALAGAQADGDALAAAEAAGVALAAAEADGDVAAAAEAGADGVVLAAAEAGAGALAAAEADGHVLAAADGDAAAAAPPLALAVCE